jgi:flagellar biosynthetic protein FlhB
VADSGGGGEKTEKPTPKRLKEARKEGQVARTPDLGGWATVLLLSLLVPSMLSHEVDALTGYMARALRVVEDPTVSSATTLLVEGAGHAFVSLLVLGSIVMVVGVACALAQGGFALATKQVKPSAKKLDPIKGAKRIFGPQALWEGVKILVKSAVVALIVWSGIKTMLPLVGGLVPTSTVLDLVGQSVVELLRTIALAGLVMAGLDYAVQRRRIGKQTRMSHQEIKQEHKQTEGDPHLKGSIRAKQLSMSRNRMIADVAHADVVLVNPTHVAVALRYEAERGAPRVVARGAGAVATRIREQAAEHGVPMVRDVPLARALHRSTEVGQIIPPELFAAVASVLAFVMTQVATPGRRATVTGTHRSPRRDEPLPEIGPRRRAPNLSASPVVGR